MGKEMSEMRIRSDRETRELQQIKRLLKEKDEDYRRMMDDMEIKHTKLEAEYNRISSQYKVMLERGSN